MPAERVDPDVASRYVRSLRPDQRNEFHVRGLPPGQYVAGAVQALEDGAHWDPAFQAALRNAANSRRFTLSEGQSLTLTLDLLP